MAAFEHVSMETVMSGDTAEPNAAVSLARREADQQCAVAGFVVLEPWAATAWRTVGACSIERNSAFALHGHQGPHLGSSHGSVRRQLRASMSRSEWHMSVRRGTRKRIRTSREDVEPHRSRTDREHADIDRQRRFDPREGHDLERLLWPGTGSGDSTDLLQDSTVDGRRVATVKRIKSAPARSVNQGRSSDLDPPHDPATSVDRADTPARAILISARRASPTPSGLLCDRP